MKHLRVAILSVAAIIISFGILEWLSVATDVECTPDLPNAEGILLLLVLGASIAGSSYLIHEIDS
jgi:hypothetical protein